jgi:predicted acetyltransferase
MKITIRHLEGEEMLGPLYQLNMYAFHSSPPFQNQEEWEAIVRGRKGVTCQAVFEDEVPVSIAVSTAMTQNMRGKLFPAAGVWGVATAPAARHKGYCKQAMAGLLAAERASGKAFANLYPFRESFYEKMGFVSFPLTKIARFAPLSLSPLLKMNLTGEIELKLLGQGFETYREYLGEMRQHIHGMAFFDFGHLAEGARSRYWTAIARIDGKVEGLMLYRMEGEEVTKFKIVAIRFYYTTSRARYLLLDWIARHIDQADRAELPLSQDECPESWLTDLQVKLESPDRPAMSRVLDVEKIGGMSAGEGAFSAKVVDPLCPWNEGAWRFEGHNGELCVSKSANADCQLTIQGLTALIAGNYDPQDIPLRGWGNPDSALQSILREIFPRESPYLHEVF